MAYGSALQADTDSDDQGHHFEAYTCDEILKRLDELKNLPSNTPTMPPLFPTEADREDFNKRHHKEHIHIGTLEGAHGPHFLASTLVPPPSRPRSSTTTVKSSGPATPTTKAAR